MRRLGIPFLLLLCSCSPVQYIEFYVTTKSTQEQEVSCMVIIDDEPLIDEKANEKVLTPATIRIPFRERRGGVGLADVKLGVKSVVLDPVTKKISRGERREDVIPYFEESRMVQWNDATIQTFFLRPNPDYVGPTPP